MAKRKTDSAVDFVIKKTRAASTAFTARESLVGCDGLILHNSGDVDLATRLVGIVERFGWILGEQRGLRLLTMDVCEYGNCRPWLCIHDTICPLRIIELFTVPYLNNNYFVHQSLSLTRLSNIRKYVIVVYADEPTANRDCEVPRDIFNGSEKCLTLHNPSGVERLAGCGVVCDMVSRRLSRIDEAFLQDLIEMGIDYDKDRFVN